MNDIRFDTLKAARDLKAAGMEEAHAEAIVATMGRAMSENLATKSRHQRTRTGHHERLNRATKTETKALEQTTQTTHSRPSNTGSQSGSAC